MSPSRREVLGAGVSVLVAPLLGCHEHVIKMVYTCREEGSAYRQPLYQSFAAKKAGLA